MAQKSRNRIAIVEVVRMGGGNTWMIDSCTHTQQRNNILSRPTRVAAPSPRASLGRRTVCGRTEQRRPQGSKRCKTKVTMVWGSFLIAAAALKTRTRNGYKAQGVNLNLFRTFVCIASQRADSYSR